MKKQRNSRKAERGVALIFALLAILLLSIIAVAIMSTTQAQTRSAANYRQTAQARYAAEAGVQSSMNWLSSTNYTAPTNFAAYDLTKYPVQYLGNPVVLSAVTGVNSNYPDAAMVAAYKAAMTKTLPAVVNTSYATYATLLRMSPSGSASFLSGGGVVQTWQITSVGTVTGINNASIQIVQTFERTGTPVFSFGLEATGNGCGSLTFGSGSSTDSYNSSQGVYGGLNVGTAGNVATNGNTNLASTAKIGGNIAAEANTVGACPAGLTDAGAKNYLGLSAVSPPLNPPLPWGCTKQPCYPPGTLITTAQNVSTGCAAIPGCIKGTAVTLVDGGASKTVNTFTLPPGSYGNLTINGADVVHVSAGQYNINSINFALDGQFVVDSGPVVFNLVGNCTVAGCPTESGLPANMSSTEVIYGAGFAGFNGCAPVAGVGVVANPDVYGKTTCGPTKAPYSGIPSNLQIAYGGTNTLRLGGMPNATVLYAPAAGYYTPGAPVGLYGSAIVKNFNDQSGSPFHYDTALQNSITQVGQYRSVGGFSWSKF